MEGMTMSMRTDFTEVFAVPGQNSIIDGINPSTGLSCINGHSLADMQQRYPNAVQMTWEDWRAEQAARQGAPVTFTESTEAQYHEMLNCLPPAAWLLDSFLVGEPTDHSVSTGQPRFQMYTKRSNVYLASSRPVTVAEFRAIASR
jgi:hypothetical protein